MARKRSAGLLVYRTNADGVEVLLGHMGGPFWARQDANAWSIPKGEYGDDETAEAAARREFVEELGLPVPEGPLHLLGEARQPTGKIVIIWAIEGDLDPTQIVPGTFQMVWPPRSGKVRTFPEIDRAGWFTLGIARKKLVTGQRTFLDRLVEHLKSAEHA